MGWIIQSKDDEVVVKVKDEPNVSASGVESTEFLVINRETGGRIHTGFGIDSDYSFETPEHGEK